MKRIICLLLACVLSFSLVACGSVVETTTVTTTTPEIEISEQTTPEPEVEVKAAQPLSVGSRVTSEDWDITLTSAYTSNTLESNESRTSWEAGDGYAFLVLEFDVECLNSSKKPVDGDAIANPVATTSTGNTYESWEYQYISSELWLYFRNTYLDANLPIHAYVYTNIPTKVMNDQVTVNLDLAGQSYELKIN